MDQKWNVGSQCLNSNAMLVQACRYRNNFICHVTSCDELSWIPNFMLMILWIYMPLYNRPFWKQALALPNLSCLCLGEFPRPQKLWQPSPLSFWGPQSIFTIKIQTLQNGVNQRQVFWPINLGGNRDNFVSEFTRRSCLSSAPMRFNLCTII